MTTSTAIDYTADIARLTAELRLRDTDPAYADAPVIDVYARISRVTSAHDEEKTPRQVAECLRNLLNRHARLGLVHVDNNRSAWKLKGSRPAFEALLSRIEAGVVQGLLCWHVDRLARQPWDLERLLRLVLQKQARAGFVVASCHGDAHLDNLSELRMRMMFAAQESESKSRRLRDLNARRREAGVLVGGASAFGHRNPGEDHISDAQLAAERDAVAWGIRELIAGSSLGSVAKEFTRRGLRTRRGVAFNPLNVRSCLFLARHAGLIEHDGTMFGPMRDAAEVAIVDTATFTAMRAVFAAREGTRGRAAADGAHYLSNLIRCDKCGRAMTGSTVRTSRYADGTARRVYRCPPQGCGGVSVDARAAEDWAGRAVVGILADPAHARAIARRSRRVAELDRLIAQTEERVDKLMTMARARLDRFDFYMEQSEVFESTRAALLTERAALVAAGAGTSTRVATEADLSEEWAEATPSERRRLVAQALPEGFHVARVGRGNPMADPARRFAVPRGVATERLAR